MNVQYSKLLLIEIHSLSRHWRTTQSQYEDTTSQSLSLNMSVLLHSLGFNKKKKNKTKQNKTKQKNKQTRKTKVDRLGFEYSYGDLAKMLGSKYLGINV